MQQSKNTKGKNWFLHSAKFIAKKFIYQQNFGATDKANKVHSYSPTQKISPGVRKVLMEYCRKFCRKAHANKKQTQKQKHPIHKHTRLNWEKSANKNFQRGNTTPKKWELNFCSFYYFMLLLQFADCLSNERMGKKSGELQYFLPRPKN